MENIRLIYEQIETAKRHFLVGTVLDCRLALILLDNVAELLMVRTLRERFSFDDFFYPRDRRPRLGDAVTATYTAKERAAAEREFEPKLRILGFRMGKISPDERAVLKVCHRLRCEAFHSGTLRRSILSQTVSLLYTTTVNLTVQLPISSFMLPPPTPAEPDARFLERFELRDATLLATDEGRGQIARKLLEGITIDTLIFAETLSRDLVERIDEHILGGLHYLADGCDADIDRNLQYTQFWRDRGISLAEAGVREPTLEEAYQQWKAEGRATYTLRRIERWRRQAVALAHCAMPSTAIDRWWAIDNRIQPLESDIGKEVDRYDNEINAEVHSRRLSELRDDGWPTRTGEPDASSDH